MTSDSLSVVIFRLRDHPRRSSVYVVLKKLDSRTTTEVNLKENQPKIAIMMFLLKSKYKRICVRSIHKLTDVDWLSKSIYSRDRSIFPRGSSSKRRDNRSKILFSHDATENWSHRDAVVSRARWLIDHTRPTRTTALRCFLTNRSISYFSSAST